MASNSSAHSPARTGASKRSGSQLSPEAIIEASLRIAARGGDDAFTVRRLGQELGCDPTAVYRHFRDKDELLLSVADRTLGEAVDAVPPGLQWRDRLRTLATEWLRVGMKYPVVSSLMASRTTRRPNEFRVVELILGAVHEAGLDGAEAVVHYRMFGDSLLSYVGQHATLQLFARAEREGDESAWNREYRLADRKRFPHIADLVDELAAVTYEEIYAARIEALLDKIERHGAEAELRGANAPGA